MRLTVIASVASIAVFADIASAAAPTRESASSPAPVIKAAPGAKGGPPNFEAIFGIFDKLFPPQPAPDPARLALARTAVASMWPDGAYGRMMSTFMAGMVENAMQLKKSDFTAMGRGTAKTDASAPSKNLSLHDQAAAKDPYFDQRLAAYRQLIDQETAQASAVIDPRMRDGLARAMARKFDARQLTDINAFFATTSGHALATQYMQLWVDPDTMRSMFTAMPEIIKLMPDAMEKMKAIDAKFPKPGKPGKDEKPAAKP